MFYKEIKRIKSFTYYDIKKYASIEILYAIIDNRPISKEALKKTKLLEILKVFAPKDTAITKLDDYYLKEDGRVVFTVTDYIEE